ncbi:MAG: hypothetical protein AB1916_13725 [Thermodesulfobacteriota bacterium]
MELSLRRVLALAVFFLVLGVANAQAGPLGPGDVTRFVGCLDELTRIFGWERNTEAEAAVQQWAEDGVEFPGIAQVMGRYGFTQKTWTETGERIVRAYAALKSEQQSRELESYLQSTLDDIRNNPTLSPERKSQMMEQVRASHARAKSVSEAPAADKAAVEPFVQQLDGLLGL